jgi:SAM-dependent methyltransferase
MGVWSKLGRMKEGKDIEAVRARGRELHAEFAERGDAFGWFEALYKEADGDNNRISWADLEPNPYFRKWAETNSLKGNGRSALVVGCGLGDDAKYLHDLGFKVTAFDISPTAIEWAKKLYPGTDIQFEVADLFQPPANWVASKAPVATTPGTDRTGFDLVLEIYTIQPLPLEMRPQVIDAVAAFVAENGRLVVVTRGREDDEEPDQMPWPLSRRDLKRFEENGLTQTDFVVMESEEEDEPPRFVVEYERAG